MKWKSAKILLPFIILIVGGLIAVILVFSGTRTVKVTQKQQEIPVHVVTAKLSKQVPQVRLYGVVESPRISKLESAILAYVKKTPILEGAYVKKNQLIILLDERDAKIIYQQRSAELAELQAQMQVEHQRYAMDKKALEHEKMMTAIARKEVQRLQSLVAKKYVSQSDLDKNVQEFRRQSLLVTARELAVANYKHRLAQLQARINKAKALLDQAALDLSRAKIVAPFNGQVTKILVSVGDRVQPGETVAELYDTQSLEVRVQIPQRYILKAQQAVRDGRKVTAIAYHAGQALHFQLVRVAGMVGSGQGALDGYFALTQKTYLPVGLALTVVISLLPVDQALMLPSHVLYGKDRIYKVVAGHLVAVSVNHIGNHYLADGRRLVILKSVQIKNGDKILLTRLPNAITGLKVMPINEKRTH